MKRRMLPVAPGSFEAGVLAPALARPTVHAEVSMQSITLVSLLLAMPAAAQNCGGTSVGFTPLSDLRDGRHLGFAGGLYQDGLAVPPGQHWTAALRRGALANCCRGPR
jgi:hypothetical protein